MKVTNLILNVRYREHMALNIMILALLLFAGLPIAAIAQDGDQVPSVVDCSVPENMQVVRPDPEGEKTKVKMGFFLIDVKEIDDVEQTYRADIFFNSTWTDPRLSEESLGRSLENCIIKLDDIWSPSFADVNRNKGEKILPRHANVNKDGVVNYKQRYIGELSSDLDFTDFPFDRQVLHFVLAAYGPDAHHIEFENDMERSGSRSEFSIEGWNVELMDAKTTSEDLNLLAEGDVNKLTRIDFRMSAERDRKYYLLNVLTPLCLIVLMAWAVFWIPPTEIGPQVGLSTATVFTLIAYRFSLSYQLPKVSYFTRIDKFVLFSTILVFVALGTAIVTSKIASDGNEERAKVIEKWARYIYLGAFIIILITTLLI